MLWCPLFRLQRFICFVCRSLARLKSFQNDDSVNGVEEEKRFVSGLSDSIDFRIQIPNNVVDRKKKVRKTFDSTKKSYRISEYPDRRQLRAQ